MSFQQEYQATITVSEDLSLPRHSGASSGSQQTAASRVTTLSKPGACGSCLTKVIVVTASGKPVQTKIEKPLFPLFLGLNQKDVVQSLRDREKHHRILERTAELAVQGERLAQQKIYEAEAEMEAGIEKLGSSKKIMQGIARKLKNREGFVAKKQIERDEQEMMNCLCIIRGTLRLWVNYWLKFMIYRTK